MLFYDPDFAAAMTAGGREAEIAGATAMGSEHLLLGLLTARGPLLHAALRAEPAVDEVAVRRALERGLDDLPYLQRLGIDPDRVLPPDVTPPRGRLSMTGSHTSDLQAALESASIKLDNVRKSGALPRERKVTSAVLWLAVLEPGTRARRLLAAMGIDADRVREAVLVTLAAHGAPTPTWPEQAQPGFINRAFQRVFRRLNVAS